MANHFERALSNAASRTEDRNIFIAVHVGNYRDRKFALLTKFKNFITGNCFQKQNQGEPELHFTRNWLWLITSKRRSC